jgi:uncharacterized protein (DUF2252 family)
MSLISREQPQHLAPDERAELGKAARARRPRSSFAEFAPSPTRPDPVEVLESQAVSRVPELVPIRYGRMAESPFAFYRGAAAVMAADIGPGPSTELTAQLCGDAHLSNFGGFATPDRHIVFGINDFDETHPGPFEWDVQRLAASFEVAGRAAGLGPDERATAVRGAARAYRVWMHHFASQTDLDVWYARLDLDTVLEFVGARFGSEVVKRVKRVARKAEAKDRFRALSRLTERVDGSLRFISHPPLLVPAEEIFDRVALAAFEDVVRVLMHSYRDTLAFKYRLLLDRYRYVHLARKVVGVGSVGERAWVVLLIGRDEGDPLIMQVKQAEASVLEPYTETSIFASHGERVVAGQSLIQASSDILLGWTSALGLDGVTRDYYVRQLWDWKLSVDIETLQPTMLEAYAALCGHTLARAHARTGDRIAIASYLGTSESFDRAIGAFAEVYADVNERDHAALLAAIDSGRISALRGV